MKTYLWIIVLLCGCLAEKERVENLAMLKNKIIQEIQKRLDDSKHLCPYKSNSTTIIRTTESLRAGAKFVKNVVVDSMEECVMECCQLKDCNVAVFKDKKKSSCYLFNCGDRHSKCVFAKDANFTVMFPNKLGSSVPSSEQSDKHASDLENLAPPEEKVLPTTTTSTTTTLKPTTRKPTTTTTTTLAPTHRQPVALFGQCRYDKDCGGSSTECLAGYCVCMDGFHAQDGICRKDCGRFEFECANEGRPLLYPQCIAIYDRCDGIKHCKDFSDEQECPRTTGPFINTGNKKDQSAGPIMGNKDQSAGQTHGMGDKDQSAGKQLPVLKPTEPEKQPSQPEQPENPNKWPHQGNMGGLPAQPKKKKVPTATLR